MQHAAAEAVEAVQHSGVVERAKEAATHAAEAVQQAAHNVVEGARHVLSQQDGGSEGEQPAPAAAPAPSEPEKNDEAQVNQTGTDGFDEAEAVTKPNTEEGQPGIHPKPDIHL